VDREQSERGTEDDQSRDPRGAQKEIKGPGGSTQECTAVFGGSDEWFSVLGIW